MTKPTDAGAGAPRADLITAAVLLALGLAMLYGGITMDRLAIRQIHPFSIPGLVPIALGAALAVCALILAVGAWRAGGLRGSGPGPSGAAHEPGARTRLGLTLCLCLAYPLLLIGTLPFWLATSTFVTVFIGLFEWQPRPPLRHGRAIATAAVQGLIVGAVTALTFERLFLVRLP